MGDRERIERAVKKNVTSQDIAWMAGLLEGEGYFAMHRDNNRLLVGVSMTDRDVLDRYALLVGSFTRVLPLRPPRKQAYRVHVTGPRAAGVMLSVVSLMGTRRTEKILECLKIWHTLKVQLPKTASRLCTTCGANFTPSPAFKGREGRLCMDCRHRRDREYQRTRSARGLGRTRANEGISPQCSVCGRTINEDHRRRRCVGCVEVRQAVGALAH